MKFYSYEYLLNKSEQNNIIQIIIMILCITILVFALYKYYKDKSNTKFRELAIIMVMAVLLVIGVNVDSYTKTKISTNQYKSEVTLLKNISEYFNITKEDIFINSESKIEGAIIKVKDDYYRVINSGKKDDYILEKMTLIEPKIELVEVNK